MLGEYILYPHLHLDFGMTDGISSTGMGVASMTDYMLIHSAGQVLFISQYPGDSSPGQGG